ncbi:MAG: DUF433 domain-containing protein [Patescibacteria group bacterium]
MGGMPCIRGLRIPVATVVGMVASGMTVESILVEYPDLEKEDIHEALAPACFFTDKGVVGIRSSDRGAQLCAPIGDGNPVGDSAVREMHASAARNGGSHIRYSRERYHRHSLRLPRHDYARGGAYFVTLCTHERECLFGQVVAGEMCPNELGMIAREEWERSSLVRPSIQLDAFVVMPNHLHGIVIISGSTDSASAGAHSRAPLSESVMATRSMPLQGTAQLPRAPRSLGSFIAGYKATTTKLINDLRGLPRVPVWQRNYHERIIADREGMEDARGYIQRNPAQWPYDKENPSRNSDSERENE